MSSITERKISSEASKRSQKMIKAQRIACGIVTNQDIADLKNRYINIAATIYLSQLSMRGPGDETRVLNEANDTTNRFLASIRLFAAEIPDSTWEKELVQRAKQEVQSSI